LSAKLKKVAFENKILKPTCTKDAVNGGIDEEVFLPPDIRNPWGCGGMVDATDLEN
jgi:hypothetical protein